MFFSHVNVFLSPPLPLSKSIRISLGEDFKKSIQREGSSSAQHLITGSVGKGLCKPNLKWVGPSFLGLEVCRDRRRWPRRE